LQKGKAKLKQENPLTFFTRCHLAIPQRDATHLQRARAAALRALPQQQHTHTNTTGLSRRGRKRQVQHRGHRDVAMGALVAVCADYERGDGALPVLVCMG